MITVSYLTLAGAAYGKRARHGPLVRAQAASLAGIESIGADLHEDLTPEILRYVSIPETEWVDLGEDIPPGDTERLKRLIGDYGVTRINVGVCDHASPEDAARRLQTLAGLLPAVTLAVEPVAFGNLRTIADIAEVLRIAQVPGAGLLYDMWQVQASYPGQRWPDSDVPVAEIQLSGIPGNLPDRLRDAGVQPASQDRATLAGSVMNIPEWLRALHALGAGCPVSYEVPRAQWRAMPCEQVAVAVAKDLVYLGV